MLKSVTTSPGTSKTVTYQYSGVGLPSSMQVSGESSFTYSYNARNQPDTITNPDSVQVSFSYDNGGRRTRVTRPGSYIEYVYNARDWLTEVRNRTTGGTTRYDATYYYQDGALWDWPAPMRDTTRHVRPTAWAAVNGAPLAPVWGLRRPPAVSLAVRLLAALSPRLGGPRDPLTSWPTSSPMSYRKLARSQTGGEDGEEAAA
jgi:YD repeat-containing protein